MSHYSIRFSHKAQKELQKLDPPIQKRVFATILRLQTTRTSQQLKSLVGSDSAQFRLRVGDYRVLYDVYHEEKVVYIMRIGHRKDIYR